MKKYSFLVIFLIIFISGLIMCGVYRAFAGQAYHGQPTSMLGQPITSSGHALDRNGVALSGPGIFYGIIVQTDGTNNCTLSVNDTSASGFSLIPANTVVSGSAKTWSYYVSPGLLFANGVYITIVTSGTCSVSTEYDQ